MCLSTPLIAKGAKMSEFVRVCKKSEVPEGAATVVTAGAEIIAD